MSVRWKKGDEDEGERVATEKKRTTQVHDVKAIILVVRVLCLEMGIWSLQFYVWPVRFAMGAGLMGSRSVAGS